MRGVGAERERAGGRGRRETDRQTDRQTERFNNSLQFEIVYCFASAAVVLLVCPRSRLTDITSFCCRCC